MKNTPEILSAISASAAIIMFTLFLLFNPQDTSARAGGGENYRSGGSSSGSGSSYRSSSSSSSYRSSYSSSSSSSSSSYKSSSTSSSSSSSSSSSGGYAPVRYRTTVSDDIISYILKVNRDGSTDVTEIYKVKMSDTQLGLTSGIKTDWMYNQLIISNLTCDKGYAIQAYNSFEFGFRKLPPKLDQTITLKYKVKGAVLPDTAGARFQWRIYTPHSATIKSIRITFPDKAIPADTKILQIISGDETFQEYKEINSSIRGNEVTFIPGKLYSSITDISTSLPEDSFDKNELINIASQVMTDKNDKHPAFVNEFDSKIIINSDRTIDREDTYHYLSGNNIPNIKMGYIFKYKSYYIDTAGGKTERKEVSNDLYLYNFNKAVSDSDSFGYRTIFIKKANTAALTDSVSYSMWGNFGKSGPLFFDLEMPPATPAYTGKTGFEIEMPSFVDKGKVSTRLYLCKKTESGYSFSTGKQYMFHEVPAEWRWENNKLICVYNHKLYNKLYLLARINLPSEGFASPGKIKESFIYLSYYWTFYPVFTILFIIAPVLILASIILTIIYSRRKAARLAAMPPYTNVDSNSINTIKSEDPGFDQQLFIDRATQIVTNLQKAWSDGDMSVMRNFVSQGIYNRFRIQLKLMHEMEKTVNLTDKFHIGMIFVGHSIVSGAYQTLNFNIGADIADVTMPIDTPEENKKQAVSKAKPAPFSEAYTFTRKRGAKTDSAKNLLAGQCPSCGFVSDKSGNSNKCPGCGTIYNSGEYDWVLTEITQGGEWTDKSASEIPGLAELAEKNISINRSIIEDRASALFWQWIAAQVYGDKSPLLRDATEKFLASPEQFEKKNMERAAVGAVDLQSVKPDGDIAGAQVLIQWSAAFTPGAEPEHRESRLDLVLPVDMKNPYGFADHSCDNCGAPLPENDAEKCSYCGEALQKTNSDWLLNGIYS